MDNLRLQSRWISIGALVLLLTTTACSPCAGKTGSELEKCEAEEEESHIPAGCTRKELTDSVIRDEESLAALDGVTSIQGSLTLTGSVMSTTALRCLTRISGELRVTSSAL